MQPDGIIQSTTGHRYPNESTIAASDFIFRTGDDDRPELWSTATAPTSVTIAVGAGALGTDRVTIIWADDTIVDEWLQVTVLAAGTNLTADEVFYFGNLVGELVNSSGEAKVDFSDLTLLLADFSTTVGIESPSDLDRDGDVDSTDSDLLSITHWNHTISLISPPAEEAYELLGTFTADAQVMTVTLSDDADGVVIADGVKVIDAAPTTTYEYDPASNLIGLTDARGFETRYGYDKLYRPTHAVNTIGGVMAYEYDAAHQQTAAVDELGRVTDYEFDLLGRLTDVTLPDPDLGGALLSPDYQYQYDLASNLTKIIDPLANETVYAYDKLYRLKTLTEPDPDGPGNPLLSPVTQYAYDDASRLTKLTDPLLRETDYIYDRLHRTTSITAPDPADYGGASGPVTAFTYDNVGNVLTRTDPDPDGVSPTTDRPVTTYDYDNLYRLEKLTEPDPGAGSPETSYVYDAASQLTQITDPLSRDTVRTFDNLGRVTQVTDELSQDTFYTFDAVSNLLFTTNDQDFSTLYAYDPLNRQTTATDARSGVTQFTYDVASNLLSLTDPARNKTTWEYDRLNRTVRETNMLADARLFEYDAADNLTRRIDREARVRDFGYDNLYRPTSETWYNSVSDADTPTNVQNTMSFSFDIASQMLTADDDFSDHTYTYDKLGRVDDVTIANVGAPSVVLDHAYDLLSRRTELTATIASTADFKNAYDYDTLSRMTQVTQTANGGNSVADKRIDFAYNALGQFTDVDRYASLDTSEKVAVTDYGYDALARLTSLTHKDGAATPATLASYTWTFDSLNRVSQFVSTDGTVDYTYDANHQLIATDSTYDTDEQYVYDLNGNRALATNDAATNAEYLTGLNNYLLSDGTFAYTYDEEGNRTAKFKDVDGDGVISSGDTDITEYTWDHRNRLIAVDDRATYSGALTQAVDYVYDTYDRRIERTIDADGAGAGSATREHFLWDGRNVALDFLDDDADGPNSPALSRRYLWGPAIDQILAEEDDAGNVQWPLTDNLGTVRDLAVYNAGTNVTTIDEHYIYDAYGNITTGDTSKTRYLYTAQEFDAATGLYYYDARHYDPATGDFLGEDPDGFRADDTNLSRYVENGPTNATDPTGLAPVDGSGAVQAPNRLPSAAKGFWWHSKDLSKPGVMARPGEGWFHFKDKSFRTVLYKGGRPDFKASGLVYSVNGILCEVEIDEITTDRAKDSRAANKKMKKKYPRWKQQKGTTWHHSSTDGTMQLVPEDVHGSKGASHTGPVADKVLRGEITKRTRSTKTKTTTSSTTTTSSSRTKTRIRSGGIKCVRGGTKLLGPLGWISEPWNIFLDSQENDTGFFEEWIEQSKDTPFLLLVPNPEYRPRDSLIPYGQTAT